MVPIGEASRQSGVHIETIRYYERTGLIPPPGRDSGGRRLFSSADMARLAFIRRCRELGFASADIRTLMGLAGRPDTACARVGELGRAQLAQIRDRIARLGELARALEELIAHCGDGRSACPMLEELIQN